ncbi:MAG TPA: hypothetical protein VEW48_07140 [Thermoanaerobaculia bacterium]|nr:hypothetical protein [Thermoanaerobaculia bacterium]
MDAKKIDLDVRTADSERSNPSPAEDLKALVKSRLEERRKARTLVSPDPAPRYDEIFEKGQEWLDGPGSPIEPVSGRRCEYPQYIWDSLPVPGRKESILRLDHLQPVGKHAQAYELTEYALHADAVSLVDEYLTWLLHGALPADGLLREVRRVLLGIG